MREGTVYNGSFPFLVGDITEDGILKTEKTQKSVGGILFTERETIIKILGRNRKEKE